MASFDKSTLVTLGVINDETEITDDAFSLISEIALDRLQTLLCDDTLALDNLPAALIPLIVDLFTWIKDHNPSNTGVQSETTENYSYSMNAEATADYLMRLRSAYPDVIAKYSKCEDEGMSKNASHNPLWTPDYYRERDPWL